MKICSSPNHEGPNPLQLSNFYRCKTRKDGYDVYCKQCKRKKSKQYRSTHATSVQANQTKWCANNPDYMKNYYQDHRETILEKNHTTYIQNSADYKARAKLWRSENLDYYAHRESLRRAAFNQAIPKWCEIEEIRKIFKKREELTEQTGIEHHVDHIIPLQSDKVCGLHCIANLQLLPASENSAKSNSFEP